MLEKLAAIDRLILSWFYQINGKNFVLDWIIQVLAEWMVYCVPVILLVAWFWPVSRKVTHKVILLRSTLAAVFGWQVINRLIGYFYFRHRPFEEYQAIKEVVFHRPDRSFPSDHVTFFFALTFSFYLAGYKKLGNFMLALSIITSLVRVTTGLHYPSDILGGATVAFIASALFYLGRGPIDKYIVLPLVKVARFFKL